jgi:hypothetical protein
MLPEDLMLLFIDEDGRMLLELVNSGRVDFEPDVKRLAVVDPTPLPNASPRRAT